MFSDELKKIWQSNLNEIKENKTRFAAVFACFIVAAFFYLTNENSTGEEINLSENPAPDKVEEIAENVDANTKIIAVKNSTTSNADKNITAVLGANSEILYVHDPFKIPQKEIIEETPPPSPEIPAVIIPPPVVAQDSPKPEIKIILRGTAIIGNKKSALIQIISDGKNLNDENLIVEVGEILNGKRIVEISQDYLIFEDGEILYLDLQN